MDRYFTGNNFSENGLFGGHPVAPGWLDDKLGNHELSNIICDCRSMLWMLESEVKHVFQRANFFLPMLQLVLIYSNIG